MFIDTVITEITRYVREIRRSSSQRTAVMSAAFGTKVKECGPGLSSHMLRRTLRDDTNNGCVGHYKSCHMPFTFTDFVVTFIS